MLLKPTGDHPGILWGLTELPRPRRDWFGISIVAAVAFGLGFASAVGLIVLLIIIG
jgi:hypothetical protein